jgi:hypothetical protein
VTVLSHVVVNELGNPYRPECYSYQFRPSQSMMHHNDVAKIPVLPRLSARRLSQRRFWRGRAPDAGSSEVTLRPTPDLLKGR